MAWLDDPDLKRLKKAAQDAGFDAPENRDVLMRGIPHGWVQSITKPNSAALFQFLGDLRALNEAARRTDGTLPLLRWLENAAELAEDLDHPARATFLDLRDRVAARASGAPAPAPVALPPGGGLELKISGADLLAPGFLARGAALTAAVAQLVVPRFQQGQRLEGAGNGTGWLLAPGLLVTNHHVICARAEGEAAPTDADLSQQALGTEVRFDYDTPEQKGVTTPVLALLDSDPALDYALLTLERQPDRGCFEPADAVKLGGAANIIQHPDGREKRVALRDNPVYRCVGDVVQYFTNTNPGASGAPVCDDAWRVIALHRSWSTASGATLNGNRVDYINEGVLFSAIQKRLESRGLWQTVLDARKGG